MKILISILTLATVFAIIIFYTKQPGSLTHADNENVYSEQTDELIRNIALSVDNEAVYIPKTVILKDRNGDIISIDDVATKHRIIYRYRMSNCSSCIDKELNIIKELFEDQAYQQDFICFFVHTHRIKDVIIRLNTLNLKCPVYFTGTDPIGLSVDEENIPYYFRLHPDLRVSNLFIPVLWNKDLSTLYLQKMLSIE